MLFLWLLFLKSTSEYVPLTVRLLIPFLCLLLYSCTKEVTIDIPAEEAKLVVDARIETHGAPIVLLMQTQYLYNPTDLASYFSSNITNATVTVRSGNITYPLSLFAPSELPLASQITLAEMLNLELNALSFFPIKVYSTLDPACLGEEGKSYTLDITYDGDDYSATTSIRAPVPLTSLSWIPDQENNSFGLCWAVLSDPVSQVNAYRWESKIITSVNGQPKDYRFRHGGSSYFSDEFFNGLTIDFDTRYPEKDSTYPSGFKRHFKYGDSVVIRFSHIEIPVYTYFDKMRSQMESNGSPFSSPVLIPSNISNGALGIWAGYGTWYDTLYCIP